MDKSDQVTGLTFERAPYSEACHTLFQTKRDHKILGSPPVTETFSVYQTLSELSGAPQTKTHASLRDACQVLIYLLVSGASFIFENALQPFGATVFRSALQLPKCPQHYVEAFTFFDAPTRLWRHRDSPGSEALPVSEAPSRLGDAFQDTEVISLRRFQSVIRPANSHALFGYRHTIDPLRDAFTF